MVKDLRRWLRLRHSRGIGAATVRKLLDGFTDLETALAADRKSLAASGIAANAIEALHAEPDSRAIENDLCWQSCTDNHIIPFISTRYPARLRSISDPPLVLYVSGDVEVLHTAQLAMVGSRNPSHSGRETAHQFARHIAATGITITSGLALGIDAASHLGALEANGLTIAVAATGLDRIYPARHRELAMRIVDEGALVSEFPPGTTARGEYFPRRNRIISGLSLGTLVVEAAVRSGSLTTAQHAMEQGREVFAIPGSIHNPMARGCHRLIKQGAKLIEVADEILEELAPQLGETHRQLANSGNRAESCKDTRNSPVGEIDTSYQQLLNCIEYDAQTIDTLIERSGYAAAEVASMLLMLELNGKITRVEGGKFSRR